MLKQFLVIPKISLWYFTTACEHVGVECEITSRNDIDVFLYVRAANAYLFFQLGVLYEQLKQKGQNDKSDK